MSPFILTYPFPLPHILYVCKLYVYSCKQFLLLKVTQNLSINYHSTSAWIVVIIFQQISLILSLSTSNLFSKQKAEWSLKKKKKGNLIISYLCLKLSILFEYRNVLRELYIVRLYVCVYVCMHACTYIGINPRHTIL